MDGNDCETIGAGSRYQPISNGKSEHAMRKLAATTIAALALPLAASLPGLAQQGSTPAQQMQPGASESKSAVNLNPDQIRQLQQSLNDNGFDAGKVDGVFGPSTRAALRQFQSKAGLPPTGELDAQTLTAVGHGDKIGAPGSSGTMGQGGSQPQQSAPAAGDRTTGQRDMSGQPAEPASPSRSPSQQ